MKKYIVTYYSIYDNEVMTAAGYGNTADEAIAYVMGYYGSEISMIISAKYVSVI